MPNVKYKLIDIEKLLGKITRSNKVRSVSTAYLSPFRLSNLCVIDFGIAGGVVWALCVSLFTILAFNGKALLITNYLETVYPGYSISYLATATEILFSLGIGIVMGFVGGFLFAAYVALLYNFFVGPAAYRVWVTIKGTIPEGKPVVLINNHNKEHLTTKENPYTVVILANPFIESPSNSSSKPAEFKIDPILNKPDIFKAKVSLILSGLANNYVVQHFMPKIRFVAIFDPAMGELDQFDQKRILTGEELKDMSSDQQKWHEMAARALCREYFVGGIIGPVQGRINRYLERRYPAIGRTDIVFAVTASETHIRSSARFTVDDETGVADSFIFRATPDAPQLKGYYRPYAEIPGMVAYSAWDERLKTPIHEFAHAMSSSKNGLIDDEYYDDLFYDTTKTIVINKRHATAEMDINKDKIFQPGELPLIFSQYIENGRIREFLTDKFRFTLSFWRSFVPGRASARIPCTMDRSGELHQFDLLIHHFMSRRLNAKVG
ncbi:MAG: hypothetical protein ACE5IW_03990 [bacterium]